MLKIRDITLGAMLLAIALTVFVIENYIPLPVPIPGYKIGLSNIITLITLYMWNKKYSFTVLILRIVTGSVICGSGITVLYSLCGGVACFAVMFAGNKLFWGECIPVVSVFGALSHNLAQLIVASFVLNTISVFSFMPFLSIVGVLSGLFTGVVAEFCSRNRYVKKLFGGGAI